MADTEIHSEFNITDNEYSYTAVFQLLCNQMSLSLAV